MDGNFDVETLGSCPEWGEDTHSSEGLGEKQGAPVRVLQQHDLSVWQRRDKRDLGLGGFC